METRDWLFQINYKRILDTVSIIMDNNDTVTIFTPHSISSDLGIRLDSSQFRMKEKNLGEPIGILFALSIF